MKTAIYPGSFDPVTLGHLHIIKRAAACFDRLIVCVMINSKKQGMFTPEERVELLKKATARFPNVEVDYSDGLLAAYAKRRKAHVVVKGLRAVSDFEQEVQMEMCIRDRYLAALIREYRQYTDTVDQILGLPERGKEV